MRRQIREEEKNVPVAPDEAILRAGVEKFCGGRITQTRNFGRIRNTELRLVDLEDGRRLVVKQLLDIHHNGADGAVKDDNELALEAWMLDYLRRRTLLPVPQIWGGDRKRLCVEYIAHGGMLCQNVARDVAHHLVRLHEITATHYGLSRDTVFDGLRQPNKRSQDWITFFREQRLLYAGRAALAEGRIDMALMARIEKLAARLEKIMTPPDRPALIHGNMRAGNILARRGKVGAFIGPALYYADPEVELAYLSLFTPFGRDFLSAYAARRHIRDEFFAVHRDIYNLYPLLMHVRLLGADYIPALTRILDRFE